jgi:murein DD-endopeptidase MepM/ murein hydrolase activator NlpD
MINAVLCLASLGLNQTGAAPNPRGETTPFDVQVAFVPQAFPTTTNVTRLFYELKITNFKPKPMEIERIQVKAGDQTMLDFAGDELAGEMQLPGNANATPMQKRILAPGQQAVVFLDLSVPFGKPTPRRLDHWISSRPVNREDLEKPRVWSACTVEPNLDKPIEIGPPLKGEFLMAANGPSRISGHRFALTLLNGQARIAQRYAIDWVKGNAAGEVFSGDAKVNASWFVYGVDAYAVSDATVVDTLDGIPDNISNATGTSDHRAVPISLDTILGNYVFMRLRPNVYAMYAHLKPGSLRVKVGDKVRTGQVIGAVGNSGNSTSPHLHFHLCTGPTPLGSEGLPYVVKNMRVTGIANAKMWDLLGRWKSDANFKAFEAKSVFPDQWTVVSMK